MCSRIGQWDYESTEHCPRYKQSTVTQIQHTRRGRSRGGACRRRRQFWGAKCAKFRRETPLLLCFRTKSDVQPVRTESLSENRVHNFEIFRKTYLTLFAQYWSSRKTHPKKRSCVIVLDTPSQRNRAAGKRMHACSRYRLPFNSPEILSCISGPVYSGDSETVIVWSFIFVLQIRQLQQALRQYLTRIMGA